VTAAVALLQRRLQNDVAQTSQLRAVEEGIRHGTSRQSVQSTASSIFPALSSPLWSRSTKPSVPPKGSIAGPNSWPCYSASWAYDSLREICNGLSCCLGKLVHLGIAKAPKKSTLSYANEHRPAALYQELFYTALERFRTQQPMGVRKRTFRFKTRCSLTRPPSPSA